MTQETGPVYGVELIDSLPSRASLRSSASV